MADDEKLDEQLRLLLEYQEAHPTMGDGPEDAKPQTMMLAALSTGAAVRTAATMSDGIQRLLDLIRGEIGYCRWDDPAEGTKYGRWYADLVGSPYYGSNGVPYCAMFVSWALAQVSGSVPGIPGAYCPWIVDSLYNNGRAISASNAQPGDIVLFDWNGGESDHIGFCESNNPSSGTMICIEGNTTGADGRSGSVARRVRYYSNIVVCGRPTYSQPAPPEPEPQPEPEPEPPAHISDRPTDNETGGGAGEMRRLFNPNSGEHVYTLDANEQEVLIGLGWASEGITCTTSNTGDRVYRLYNPYATGVDAHHYTKSLAEAQALWDIGWEFEGVSWYSAGGCPVMRLFSPDSGEHLYTKDLREIGTLCDNGWTCEGVGWWALS